MDEVIYLEQDEEITSVIDKIKNMEANSISLVIPKDASILQSIVNLKILKKEAENLSKKISLVTHDKIGRNLASQVGLSVYDTISDRRPVLEPTRPEPDTSEVIELDLTPKQETRVPRGVQVHRYDERANRPEHARQHFPTHIMAKPLSAEGYKIPPVGKPSVSGKKKLFFIIVVTLLILIALAAFYFFYVKAIITLNLSSEPFQEKIDITIDDSINKLDDAKLAIPGELQETEANLEKPFSATGTKDVGEKAKGTIKLSNGTGDEQFVASGSEVKSSDGLMFIATSNATVPKATASVDSGGNVVKKSGTADLTIEAKESGSKFNASGAFIISLNLKLTADGSTSGGTTKELKVVSQDDINRAKVALIEELKKTNREAITKKAGKNKIMDTSVIDEVTAFSVNKEAGTEGDSFTTNLKLKSKTLSFNEDDYRQIITKALEKNVPQNKELLLSPSDEISTSFSEADFSKGIIKISGTVKTSLVTKIPDNQIISDIKGKGFGDAEVKLKQTQGVNSVKIIVRPSWWFKKVPSTSRGIVITKTTK